MTELSISDPRDFPNVTVYWRPGPIYRIAFKNREFARGGQAALRGLMGLIAVLGVIPTAVAFGIYAHFFFGAWYYGAGFIIILFLALQLHFLLASESMGFHDSEVMDDRCIGRGDA